MHLREHRDSIADSDTQNLILCEQRMRLKDSSQRRPICGFFAAGTRRDVSVIAKDLLPAHTWDAVAKTGWYGSLAA